MANLPLKLPATMLAQLQRRAALLGCARAALARDLIADGLQRLEASAPIDKEVA